MELLFQYNASTLYKQIIKKTIFFQRSLEIDWYCLVEQSVTSYVISLHSGLHYMYYSNNITLCCNKHQFNMYSYWIVLTIIVRNNMWLDKQIGTKYNIITKWECSEFCILLYLLSVRCKILFIKINSTLMVEISC